MDLSRQAFNFLTAQTLEMDVFMGVMIFLASPAQGEIILAIIRDKFMDDSVFAEPVQYPVDGNAVHFILYLLFEYILAERRRGGFQQLQHQLFGGCISSVHSGIFCYCKDIAIMGYGRSAVLDAWRIGDLCPGQWGFSAGKEQDSHFASLIFPFGYNNPTFGYVCFYIDAELCINVI